MKTAPAAFHHMKPATRFTWTGQAAAPKEIICKDVQGARVYGRKTNTEND